MNAHFFVHCLKTSKKRGVNGEKKKIPLQESRPVKLSNNSRLSGLDFLLT